jgi:hypothetical protein
MIKAEIDKINNLIIDSQLVERYGKYCTHKTDKDIPYGYGKEKDCKGNTYTFDERLETVAYLSLLSFQTRPLNRMANYLDINFQVHHFTNQKKVDSDSFFGRGQQIYVLLFKEIQEKYKLSSTVNIKTSSLNLPDNCEYVIIDIKVTTIVDCNYSPEIDPELC